MLALIKLLLETDLRTRTPLLKGNVESNLYSIPVPHPASSPSFAFAPSQVSSSLWHSRLGHQSKQVLSSLQSKHSLDFSDFRSLIKICTACIMGKSHKLAFSSSSRVSTIPLEVVHCDVWGPAPTSSFSGFRYFVLFVDDYSRYTSL